MTTRSDNHSQSGPTQEQSLLEEWVTPKVYRMEAASAEGKDYFTRELTISNEFYFFQGGAS